MDVTLGVGAGGAELLDPQRAATWRRRVIRSDGFDAARTSAWFEKSPAADEAPPRACSAQAISEVLELMM
jgi:hypothetical protein